MPVSWSATGFRHPSVSPTDEDLPLQTTYNEPTELFYTNGSLGWVIDMVTVECFEELERQASGDIAMEYLPCTLSPAERIDLATTLYPLVELDALHHSADDPTATTRRFLAHPVKIKVEGGQRPGPGVEEHPRMDGGGPPSEHFTASRTQVSLGSPQAVQSLTACCLARSP